MPPAGRLARVAADARIAWAVALALAVVLGVVSVLVTPVVVEAREREEVTEVAAAMAGRLVSFEGDDLDRWVERVSALATPAYAAEVAGLLDPEVRARAAEAEVRSSGEPLDVLVQRIEDGEALAFAVVRQRTSGAAAGAEAVSSTVRMTLRLERGGGGWRVADVAVLGPAAGPAGPLPAPGG